jgi:hypothetical protein
MAYSIHAFSLKPLHKHNTTNHKFNTTMTKNATMKSNNTHAQLPQSCGFLNNHIVKNLNEHGNFYKIKKIHVPSNNYVQETKINKGILRST